MKKVLMAAVALTAITATPAFAADTVSTYAVSGSVTAVCSAASTGTTIAFGALTDANGSLNATDKQSSDATAYCNGGGTTIKVEHTDLTNTDSTQVASPPAGFTGVVSFVPVVEAGSGASKVTLTGDQAALTALGAFSGLVVKATSPSVTSGTKPLAGSYTGQIKLTITPGV